MKVTYTTPNRLSVELEGNTQVELFKQLADFQEVFDQNGCGKCQKKNLKFVVRNVEDNDFYEVACTHCGCRLSFGQHKKGGSLFPKNRDDKGGWLPNRGWGKWDNEKKKVVYE